MLLFSRWRLFLAAVSCIKMYKVVLHSPDTDLQYEDDFFFIILVEKKEKFNGLFNVSIRWIECLSGTVYKNHAKCSLKNSLFVLKEHVQILGNLATFRMVSCRRFSRVDGRLWGDSLKTNLRYFSFINNMSAKSSRITRWPHVCRILESERLNIRMATYLKSVWTCVKVGLTFARI